MINMLGEMLGGKLSSANQSEDTIKKMTDFSNWIGIYGSDESVRAFHNWMQAIYASPPVQVLLRLYGDFLIAVRKDMGYTKTSVERQHLLGMRINDIYKYSDVVDSSFEDVCERLGWQPPWLADDVVSSRRGSPRKRNVT